MFFLRAKKSSAKIRRKQVLPAPITVPASTVPLLVAAGYLNIDVVARVPFLPAADQRATADRIWRLLGGMAANTACGAASLGAPWATQVELLTFVGDDPESDWALAEVERRGVTTGWSVRQRGGFTPRCIILVEPNGQRVIVSEPISFDDSLIARRVAAPEQVGRPCRLHVDGYRVPAALPALAAARAAGWRTSVDLDGLDASWRDENTLCRLLQAFDVIFANRNAVEAIWPGLLQGAESLSHVAHKLRCLMQQHGLPGGLVIVTLGADGVLVISRDDQPQHVAALAVAPVDTTGAGDIFAGVFLVMLLHGHDPASAAQHAAIAAGLSTTGFGAQGRLPSAAEVLAEMLPVTTNVVEAGDR